MVRRRFDIDLLRTVGLFLVILDHVKVSGMVASVCLFDVPLLVFVSGLSSGISSANQIHDAKDYLRYLWKRVSKLLFPTYVTVTAVCLLGGAANGVLHWGGYSGSQILRSFLLLQKSIGYVWIVRIYLMLAVVCPILLLLRNRISGRFSLIFVLCVMNFACYLFCEKIPRSGGLYQASICYLIPYAIIYYMGLSRTRASEKSCATEDLVLWMASCAVYLYIMTTEWGGEAS